MAGEAAIINTAARASLWLQPHRIILILIGLGLVLSAAFFMGNLLRNAVRQSTAAPP